MSKSKPSVGSMPPRQPMSPPLPPDCKMPGCRLPAEADRFYCDLHA